MSPPSSAEIIKVNDVMVVASKILTRSHSSSVQPTRGVALCVVETSFCHFLLDFRQNFQNLGTAVFSSPLNQQHLCSGTHHELVRFVFDGDDESVDRIVGHDGRISFVLLQVVSVNCAIHSVHVDEIKTLPCHVPVRTFRHDTNWRVF